MSDEVRTLVASIAYRLGGASGLARAAGLPLLHDSLVGLQNVLGDPTLQIRSSDGRSLMHALRGFEGILCDLQVPDHAELVELRGALAAAQAAARQLADLLERPPLFGELRPPVSSETVHRRRKP